jgi:predicted nucleic acid-binding protein
MEMRPIRTYVETSVFGGVFDDEFARPSAAFFEAVREGRFQAVVSPLVETEIASAPENVQDFYDEMLRLAEATELSDEAVQLQRAYLSTGIVGPRRAPDALHVALATVANCAMIVSWNFKHIVNFQKIPLYNAVNASHGYNPIAIYSPLEVVEREEEEV